MRASAIVWHQNEVGEETSRHIRMRWVRRQDIRMRWRRRQDMVNLVLEMSRRQYLLEGCDHLTAVSWRPEQSKVSYRSPPGSSCEE